MQISVINLNLTAQDAIGHSILNQVRFFRRRGDAVNVYLMHPPEHMPEDAAALTRVVTLADLVSRRDDHFARSDVYVYHYPLRYPLVESIKGIDRGVVILYYHNVTPPDLGSSAFERDALRYSRNSLSELTPYADLLVTDSPYNADELISEHGCEKERVRVLPLAVGTDQFHPGETDPALVRRYGLDGRQVILFVGRMAGNKRIDLLIEALSLVRQRVPQAALMLVGDDQSNPAIRENVARARARARALGVSDAVIFTGRVDHPAPYYRLASAYASASLHEGFGVPLIEAMASGLPVIASRATAHPWVVGEAGLLAEPGDAADLARQIERVLTDSELRHDLAHKGLAHAKTFSLRRYEEGWSEIVVEATARLPDQSYPRPRSLAAQLASRAESLGGKPGEWLVALNHLQSQLLSLESEADVMMRSYVVRSRQPIIGGLIAWVRRNMTSHLREPYIDPTFERQVAYNRQVAGILRELIGSIMASIESLSQERRDDEQRQRALAHELKQIEARLGLMVLQMSALQAGHSGAIDPEALAEVRQQIDSLRASLLALDTGESS